MPTRVKKACSLPGCPNLTDGGRCPAHRQQAERDRRKRMPWRDWYSTPRWRDFRERYLQVHPLCVTCEGAGKVTPATVVDHITPHKGDAAKFWQGPFAALTCRGPGPNGTRTARPLDSAGGAGRYCGRHGTRQSFDDNSDSGMRFDGATPFAGYPLHGRMPFLEVPGNERT
jgi:5-methylcytosine-specific restriction protein A